MNGKDVRMPTSAVTSRQYERRGAKILSLATRLAFIFLCVLPSLLVLMYIHTYAVNVPRWDEWDFVPLIRRWYEGRLTFGELFAQYDEQRLLFPRLVMLAGVLWAQHNVVLHMYASWLLLTASGISLFLICRRIFSAAGVSLAYFLPVPWLLFSLRQRDSLLWGWQIQWYLAVSFCVVALYLVDSTTRIWPRFVLALASGVVASFSLAAGLLTWPAGLVLLIWKALRADQAQRRHFRFALIWAVAGCAIFFLYFKDYQPPDFAPNALIYLSQPLAVLYFCVLTLGGTLSMEHAHALAFGLLLIPCYALILVSYARLSKGSGSVSGVPLALVVFALLFIGQLVLGRSWLGPDKALDSKYVPVTLIGLIGLYLGLLDARLIRQDVRLPALGGLLALSVAGAIAAGQQGIDYGEDALQVRSRLAYVLANYRFQDDANLARLGREGADVRRLAALLEKQRLSVFSVPQPSLAGLELLPGRTPFYVDTLNGQEAPQTAGARVQASRDPMIVLSGWALDGATGRPTSAVFVDIDGNLQVPALLGLDRHDIGETLRNPDAHQAGFQAEVATALVGPGRHRLSILIVPENRAGFYLGEHTITLDVS
jgi:hypothetical protein